MPRSWPNTEAERGRDLGTPGSGQPGASVIEVEVVDLGRDASPRPMPASQAPSARGWLIWLMVGAMIGGGLALIPGNSIEPPATTATGPVLPAPGLASTTTTLGATTRAVMSDTAVSLTPASGLEGFDQLTRPVDFNGKHWIVGNHGYPSADATILSSADGTTWEIEATVSAADGGWLRIDDLGRFEGVLMAVGTEGSEPGPAYAPPTSGALVLWKSTDGRRWSSSTVAGDNRRAYLELRLTTSPEEVLITGAQEVAFDRSLLDQIPPGLVPGLDNGDFSLRSFSSSVRVIAPPGIELFRVPVVRQAIPERSPLLFRSGNLIIWEQPAVGSSIRNVATTPDGGFVSYDVALMYSTDGRTWQRTERYPPLFFQNWGNRLVGAQRISATTTRLFVFDGDEEATIDLPSEIASSNEVSLTPGIAGVAALQGTWNEPRQVEPITQVDGYILAMDNGVLRIKEPSGASSYARFDNDGLIEGTYLPEKDSIRFETADGSKSFEFPVSVFLDLEGTPPRRRFDVFVTEDGLSWARAQTGLLAAHVEVLGSTDNAFLILLHNYATNSQPLPITVYKTGPPG
jgi:hypothetical protein